VKITKIMVVSVFIVAFFATQAIKSAYHSNARGTPCSTNLQAALTLITEIENQLANQVSCAATPISQADIDAGAGIYTITKPGNYCLTENVTGSIMINASNVSFDLNSFNITVESAIPLSGIVINGDYVSVQNGTLTGETEFSSSLSCTDFSLNRFCISVCNHNYLRFSDLSINNIPATYGFGIDITDCNSVIIERVTLYQNATALAVSGSTDIFIVDSIFDGNYEYSSIVNNNRVLISGCQFTNGVYGPGLVCSGLTDLVLVDSHALFNGACGCACDGSTPSGFLLNRGTTNFEIINCNAIKNYGNGFTVDDSCNDGFLGTCNALANTNGAGFSIDADSSVVIVRDCNANANTGFGFKSGTASVRFWDNAGVNNNSGSDDFSIASGDPVLVIGHTTFAAGYNVATVVS